MRVRNGRRRSGRPSRVLALASGKGGVGRTTVAVELSKALARHGQSVLLVDLDPRGLALVTLMEVPPPGPAIDAEDVEAMRLGPVATGIEQVSLLLLNGPRALLRDASEDGGECDFGAQVVAARLLMQRLRGLGYDLVVLDLGGGHSTGLVATLMAADLPVLVTTPEPPALVAGSHLLRACAVSSVRQHEARESAAPLLAASVATPVEWDFIHLFRSVGSDRSRGVLVEACQRLQLGLILNQVREGSEVEQAGALCHAWGMDVGVWPRALGTVQHDERRWFYVRRLAPASQHVQGESLAGDVDQLARRVVSIDWADWREPRPCLPCVDPSQKPGVFLDLGGGGQDARQRYRRLWEAYRRDSGLVSYVMGPAARKRTVRLLEQAYRASMVESPDSSGLPNPEATPMPPSLSGDPGKMLRQERMQRSLGLRELSLRTRVGVRHIEAIEAMRLRDLPSRVYLKAYLAEIARTLELDPEVVISQYLTFLDAGQA